jgi:hypothetical protein
LTGKGGLAVFSSFEPDIRGFRAGDSVQGAGTASLVFRSEAQAGAYASLAERSPWPWLAFGVSGKYLALRQSQISIDVISQDDISEAKTGLNQLSNTSGVKRGMGIDASSLAFFQGQHLDLRFAFVLENIVPMTLSDASGSSLVVPTSVNLGAGLTFHSSSDAIHLSADWRDALGSQNPRDLLKKVFFGAKYMLRTYIGLATGLYHGVMSTGFEVDLILLRLAAAAYTREYGGAPGLDSRKVFIFSVSTGYNF